MQNKKGAIGLSLNMIVVIIISLVILGAGITLLYNFIGGSLEVKDILDARTEQELSRLLTDQGKKVALPFYTKTIPREASEVYGIGILNINPTTETFLLLIEPRQAFDEAQQDILVEFTSRYTLDQWLNYNNEPFSLDENEIHKEVILATVPNDAPLGTYVFTVKIMRQDGTQYGNTQRIVVVVK